MSELQQLTGLWKNKDKNGKDYYSGNLGNMKVLIMENGFKKEQKQPDAFICLAPKEFKKETQPEEASPVEQAIKQSFGVEANSAPKKQLITYTVSIDVVTKKEKVIKMKCTNLDKKDYPQYQIDCTLFRNHPMYDQINEGSCGTRATITGYIQPETDRFPESFIIQEIKLEGQVELGLDKSKEATENEVDDDDIPF